MKNKKELNKLRKSMFYVGIPSSFIEILLLLLGILKNIWIPFVTGIPLIIIIELFIAHRYYDKVAYLCSNCYKIFKPSFRNFLFSKHTTKTRKLTCENCGNEGFSIEVYGEGEDEGGSNEK